MTKMVLAALKDYFEQEPSILLAFIFGSELRGQTTEESDVDLAIYPTMAADLDEIWTNLIRVLGKSIDLVDLRTSPATLIGNIFKTGLPIVIKDRSLYWKLLLTKTLESEDFSNFVTDYQKIAERSKSLIPEDKTRFIDRLHFLESELSELARFQQFSFRSYQSDRSKRREIERWAENIINATLDVAKIVLASQKQLMPKTYEEALLHFGILAGLDEPQARRLARFAELRNILAHEYLDLIYDRLQVFIKEFPDLYQRIAPFIKGLK